LEDYGEDAIPVALLCKISLMWKISGLACSFPIFYFDLTTPWLILWVIGVHYDKPFVFTLIDTGNIYETL
jgi:hypothetical protein